jgi:hypothetical protein
VWKGFGCVGRLRAQEQNRLRLQRIRQDRLYEEARLATATKREFWLTLMFAAAAQARLANVRLALAMR